MESPSAPPTTGTPDEQKQALRQALAPIEAFLATLDPAAPKAAALAAARFPLDGPELLEIRARLVAGLEAGWLCPREADGVRFGRLSRPGPEGAGFAIDAVDLSGPGPGHLHPRGEFALCFALEGKPRFDGRPPGWTVYAPGSWHVPTVLGGRMGILYFLPGGAIRFGAAA